MVKPPTPARPRRRRRRRTTTERKRSATGRVVGALIGVATAAGVGTGLATPVAESAQTCGGTERWSVKVATDPDAKAIDPNPIGPFSVADVNRIKPGPIGSGGRMAAEKKLYTVRGFVSYFDDEEDGDYHVVITDRPGDFSHGRDAPNGRSMVVELPDTGCYRGKSGQGPANSVLNASLADARAQFEENAKGISGKKIGTRPIPVTVTGVGFFDREHGQTGRAVTHLQSDGREVAFELHPVTEFTFHNADDDDS